MKTKHTHGPWSVHHGKWVKAMRGEHEGEILIAQTYSVWRNRIMSVSSEVDFTGRNDEDGFYLLKPFVNLVLNNSLSVVFSEDEATEREREIWNAAITLANNICVQESDRRNAMDDTREADAANECAKRVRGFIIDADDTQLIELLSEAGVPDPG